MPRILAGFSDWHARSSAIFCPFLVMMKTSPAAASRRSSENRDFASYAAITFMSHTIARPVRPVNLRLPKSSYSLHFPVRISSGNTIFAKTPTSARRPARPLRRRGSNLIEERNEDGLRLQSLRVLIRPAPNRTGGFPASPVASSQLFRVSKLLSQQARQISPMPRIPMPGIEQIVITLAGA